MNEIEALIDSIEGYIRDIRYDKVHNNISSLAIESFYIGFDISSLLKLDSRIGNEYRNIVLKELKS